MVANLLVSQDWVSGGTSSADFGMLTLVISPIYIFATITRKNKPILANTAWLAWLFISFGEVREEDFIFVGL